MKNFHKGCLTPCRPLGTSKSKVRSHVLNVLQIKDELLQPLSYATAESDGLGCLVVPFTLVSVYEVKICRERT